MKYLYLLICLLLCGRLFAQQENVVLHIIDALDAKPVSSTRVLNPSGVQVAHTDSDGYIVLPLSMFSTYKYLLLLAPGYNPDTLHVPGAATIFLQPLSVTLGDAVVSSRKVKKLLNAPREYVVDYAVTGNEILVATYSGAEGKKAKLHLVSNEGNILTSCSIPNDPRYLYKSCAGTYYCVYRDQFYPIATDSGRLRLKPPYPISLLAGMQECELLLQDNFYYRVADKMNFRMLYGMVHRGDTVFHPLARFENRKVAQQSMDEYMEILYWLSMGNFHKAAKLQRLRSTWDRSSYAHLDMPLFHKADSLVIFDYEQKRICCYLPGGEPAGEVAVQFEWLSTQRFSIIKDEGSDRFYIHRFAEGSRHTLEELDIHTGKVAERRTTLDYPFPEQVRVHNGAAYFLFQDGHNAATRQLYVQPVN